MREGAYDFLAKPYPAERLIAHGFQVEAHASARAALPVLTRAFDGVVVTDIRMPDMDGLQLFQRLRDLDAEIPVILITGHGDIATAVQCMREGAYDFLAKPYPAERLIATIGHAAEKRRLVLENAPAGSGLRLGRRGAIHRQYPGHAADQQTLRHIADADVDVLVEGETGTGKEVVASALHRLSRRRQHELVAINAARCPKA